MEFSFIINTVSSISSQPVSICTSRQRFFLDIAVSAAVFCIFNFVSQCSNMDVYCYDFEDHSGTFGTQISLKGLGLSLKGLSLKFTNIYSSMGAKHSQE